MRRRKLLARIRRWIQGALLLPPAFACGGSTPPKDRQPVEIPDEQPPAKIPPPILHRPMEQLDVEVLGPEVDAPTNVLDISVDLGGGIWLASDQGVFVRPPGEVFFRGLTVADGLPPAHARSVGGLSSGSALLGFEGVPARVVRLARDFSVDSEPMSKVGEVFRATTWDRPEGRLLLLATSNGLALLDEHGTLRGIRALPSPATDLADVAFTGEGDVWVGDTHRLARLHGPVDRSLGGALSPVVDLIPDAPDDVVAVEVCQDGSVWASLLGHGVFHLSADGVHLETLSRETSLPQDHVPALACDLDGSLWIGTSWGGLVRRTPDGDFRYHGVAAGLPGDSIRRLLIVPEGNGRRTLWIGTEGGAAAYRGP